MAGASGQWLLKPTIKVLNTKDDHSIITGNVKDENLALPGVLVSAQKYDPDVVLQTSTSTDEFGDYSIFIQAGTYNIVAYKDTFNPVCVNINTVNNTNPKNFVLSDANTDKIDVSVAIPNTDDEQYATISFRQSVQCDGILGEQQIEVKSLNLATGGPYSVILPVLPSGTYYSVVVSTYNRNTQSYFTKIYDTITVPDTLNIEIILPNSTN